MKNTKTLILVIMLVCCAGIARAYVIFNDGQTHNIDSTINSRVYIYDSSTGIPTVVNLIDRGFIMNDVAVSDNSVFNMFGGWINWDLVADDKSSAYISGGVVNLRLLLYHNSQLIIEGTDFNYAYGTYTNTSGLLTGTLLDGTPLNNEFQITGSATMTLVPEPSSLLLLGLGALMLRRKR